MRLSPISPPSTMAGRNAWRWALQRARSRPGRVGTRPIPAWGAHGIVGAPFAWVARVDDGVEDLVAEVGEEADARAQHRVGDRGAQARVGRRIGAGDDGVSAMEADEGVGDVQSVALEAGGAAGCRAGRMGMGSVMRGVAFGSRGRMGRIAVTGNAPRAFGGQEGASPACAGRRSGVRARRRGESPWKSVQGGCRRTPWRRATRGREIGGDAVSGVARGARESSPESAGYARIGNSRGS